MVTGAGLGWWLGLGLGHGWGGGGAHGACGGAAVGMGMGLGKEQGLGLARPGSSEQALPEQEEGDFLFSPTLHQLVLGGKTQGAMLKATTPLLLSQKTKSPNNLFFRPGTPHHFILHSI